MALIIPNPAVKPLPEKEQSEKVPISSSLSASFKDYIETLAYLRIWHILGDKKACPPIKPLLPISRSSFYAGIKAGIYPAPVKLSKRCVAWRVEDIEKLLRTIGQNVE